jgi:O-antigen ligase
MPFGANNLWLWTLLMSVMGLGLIYLGIRWPSPRQSGRTDTWLDRALIGFSLSIVTILIIQVLPVGPEWVHPIWLLVNTRTEGFFGGSISINPLETLFSAAWLLALLLVGVVIMRATQPEKVLKTVVWIISLSGFYGLVVLLADWRWVMWAPKLAYFESLTGPLINRNHTATLLGLGMMGAIAIGLQRIGEISSRLKPRQRWKAWYDLVLTSGWPWLLVALLLYILIILTQSRAGLGASAAGALVMLASLGIARPAIRWSIFAIIIVAGMIGFSIFALTGSEVSARMASLDRDGMIRTDLAQMAWHMADEMPILGHGAGAFEAAAGPYRDPSLSIYMTGRIDHAHDDYAEWVAETGWVGAGLATLLGLVVVAILARRLVQRRRGIIWPAMGLGVLALVGTHASVDFSLQIPVVALVTVLLISLALQRPGTKEQLANKVELGPAWQRGAIAVMGVMITIAGSYMTLTGWTTYQSNQAWQTLLRSEAAPTTAELLKLRVSLTKALEDTPWQPETEIRLGWTLDMLANKLNNPIIRNQAILNLQHGLTRNPAHATGWFVLSRALMKSDNQITSAKEALINSIQVQPRQPPLMWARVRFMLVLWSQLNDEETDLVKKNLTELWQALPKSNDGKLRKNLPITPETLKVWIDWRDLQGLTMIDQTP